MKYCRDSISEALRFKPLTASSTLEVVLRLKIGAKTPRVDSRLGREDLHPMRAIVEMVVQNNKTEGSVADCSGMEIEYEVGKQWLDWNWNWHWHWRWHWHCDGLGTIRSETTTCARNNAWHATFLSSFSLSQSSCLFEASCAKRGASLSWSNPKRTTTGVIEPDVRIRAARPSGIRSIFFTLPFCIF